MRYRQRIHYTEADKALMWDRWEKGETLTEIAHLFDRREPQLGQVPSDYASGRLQAMGEVGTQYTGIAPNSPALEQYFSIAVELDLPR